jgi:hypothetical protein
VPSRGAVAVGGRRLGGRGPAVQGCSVWPALQGCVPAASCAAQLVLPATVHASPPGGLPRAARAGPATRMALARGPPARLSPQCHQFLRAPSRSRARCRRAACPVQVGDAARRGAHAPLCLQRGANMDPVSPRWTQVTMGKWSSSQKSTIVCSSQRTHPRRRPRQA